MASRIKKFFQGGAAEDKQTKGESPRNSSTTPVRLDRSSTEPALPTGRLHFIGSQRDSHPRPGGEAAEALIATCSGPSRSVFRFKKLRHPMLNDTKKLNQEDNEELNRRREKREEKKKTVKKQYEEFQAQGQRVEEAQPAVDVQSRLELLKERTRLEEERKRMEKEMEERVKREVEEKMKKHEQELREQYERQIRQQEKERQKMLDVELEAKKAEIEARIQKEHEMKNLEAQRLLEEEKRNLARKRGALQATDYDAWRNETEIKLRREIEEAEQSKQGSGDEKSVWKLSPGDIVLGKELGRGAFGVVYAGKLHGKEVAVKKLLPQEIDQEELSSFRHEVEIMARLRHPNILLFMGACLEGDQLMIVTELMPRGSVDDLIRNSKNVLSFKQRMKMAKDCVLGMNWLHRLNPPFLHLDLKLGNLLVDQNWNVKVADFGLSKVYNPDAAAADELVGSPFYMAPEMLLQKEFDEKVDVYAFGVVLWELYTMQEPYMGLFESLEELIEAVALDGERPEIPNDCPPILKKLIVSCWQDVPSARPSFEDILREKTLDIVTIQSAVSDPTGQAFWLDRFPDYDVLEWQEWLTGFRQYFSVSAAHLRDDCPLIQSLKLLLCGDKSQSVTLEAWGNALQWFGPMDRNGTSFLNNLSNVTSKGWFFGDISRVEAESLLRVSGKGFFLIRFSASQPGSFTISFLFSPQTGPKHIRINRNAGGQLIYSGATYPTLDEFIRAQQQALNLKMFCPGSTFAKLWEGRQRLGEDDEESKRREADEAYSFFG